MKSKSRMSSTHCCTVLSSLWTRRQCLITDLTHVCHWPLLVWHADASYMIGRITCNSATLITIGRANVFPKGVWSAGQWGGRWSSAHRSADLALLKDLCDSANKPICSVWCAWSRFARHVPTDILRRWCRNLIGRWRLTAFTCSLHNSR